MLFILGVTLTNEQHQFWSRKNLAQNAEQLVKRLKKISVETSEDWKKHFSNSLQNWFQFFKLSLKSDKTNLFSSKARSPRSKKKMKSRNRNCRRILSTLTLLKILLVGNFFPLSLESGSLRAREPLHLASHEKFFVGKKSQIRTHQNLGRPWYNFGERYLFLVSLIRSAILRNGDIASASSSFSPSGSRRH